MTDKKAVAKLEKYLAFFHDAAKTTEASAGAITLQDHYERMADFAGKCIKIVEGRL